MRNPYDDHWNRAWMHWRYSRRRQARVRRAAFAMMALATALAVVLAAAR